MRYNVDAILDAHTHLTEDVCAEQVLECMDLCRVERAFVFALILHVRTREITSDNLEDIRAHNDYCADVCSADPQRLLGFCTLNPTRAFADGDLERAVDLNIEEAERCYDELGLRGTAELIVTGRCADNPALLRLSRALVGLGIYQVHSCDETLESTLLYNSCQCATSVGLGNCSKNPSK